MDCCADSASGHDSLSVLRNRSVPTEFKLNRRKSEFERNGLVTAIALRVARSPEREHNGLPPLLRLELYAACLPTF